jgi:hypothetical protein
MIDNHKKYLYYNKRIYHGQTFIIDLALNNG